MCSEFEAWRADCGGGVFSEWLRECAGPVWDAAVEHQFVAQLFRGSVPDGVMRTYLVQDYQFLDRFVALLGAAVASADRYSSRVVLGQQLGLVTGAEDTYFQQAFDTLQVPEADRRSPQLATATHTLNTVMAEAADSRVYPYCLTVLTVAEWLYEDWARRAPAELPEQALYRDWITLHNTPEFRSWVGWLREELDRTGPQLDSEGQQHCRDLFARTTLLERDFFDTAYHEPSAPSR